MDKEQPKEQEQDNEGGIASADIEFWAEQTQDYMDDAPDFDSGMPMDDDIQLDQSKSNTEKQSITLIDH